MCEHIKQVDQVTSALLMLVVHVHLYLLPVTELVLPVISVLVCHKRHQRTHSLYLLFQDREDFGTVLLSNNELDNSVQKI